MNSSFKINDTFITKAIGRPTISPELSKENEKPSNNNQNFSTPKKSSLELVLMKHALESPKSPRFLDYQTPSKSSGKKSNNTSFHTPDQVLKSAQCTAVSKILLKNKKINQLNF